jgi:uncharacterized linocin/CFP29 family protein
MNDLRRELAPIDAAAWQAIDDEARSALTLALAARKLVDFEGPSGWSASAISLGRTQRLRAAPGKGVDAVLRQVQPFVELRAAFTLSREELDAVPRGAKDADLKPVTEAAQAIAAAEDRAVFHGYAAAGIRGICEAAQSAALTITEDYEAYPAVVAKALAELRSAGVDGPYAIALGPRCYTGLMQTATKGGYPVIQHVRRLIDGPVVWAPAVDGAAVLSLREGDFQLTVGRDFSIGYAAHTADAVELYIEESFTFRVIAPEAAVPLVYRQSKKS